MNAHIVVLPGDGIGPEVTAEAVRALQAVARTFGHQFTFAERLMGGCSIDAHGVALTPEVLKDCQASAAVLLGAVGGPKWDDPTSKVRPEQGLLALRKGLGVFANLRPVKVHPALLEASPIKADRLAGVDILVIRELTGGLYFGQPKGRSLKDGVERAVDTLEYADFEVKRVVELAFKLAGARKKKVTSVDKANVLESSRLWRQITTGIGQQHPGIALDHMLVDTAAMRLITGPAWLDVVVTENINMTSSPTGLGAGRLDGHVALGLHRRAAPGLYSPSGLGAGHRLRDLPTPSAPSSGRAAAAPLSAPPGRRRRWT
jgi:3-isopropylmalate dehydrogenase